MGKLIRVKCILCSASYQNSEEHNSEVCLNCSGRPIIEQIVSCNDCNSKITDWDFEGSDAIFDCPKCGCTNRESVTIEEVER